MSTGRCWNAISPTSPSQPGGHGMKKTRIGGLNLFFQNIRQHGWDDTLPGTAAFYPGDIPPVPEQVDRRLAEYVMAQIEAPANLDRWPNPAGRLVTLILTRCGLRISSALALGFDCLLHDGQGAPYLRYFNTKMRREAAVPIDEELEAGHPRSAAPGTGPVAGRHGLPVSPAARQRLREPPAGGQQLPADAGPLAGDLRDPRRARPAGAPDTPSMAPYLRLPADQPGRPARSRPGPAGP